MATDTLTLDPVNVTASAPTPSRREPPPPDTEELVIVTGGQRLSGWTSVRVVAGAEIFPRHFEIECTERFPNQISKAIVAPRDRKTALGTIFECRAVSTEGPPRLGEYFFDT
jgi:hypothetical protein